MKNKNLDKKKLVHSKVTGEGKFNVQKNAYIKHSTQHEHEKEEKGIERKLPTNMTHG